MRAHSARSRSFIIAAFAAIYLVWGSTYLAIAFALRSWPPFLLMGTRSLAGGTVLLVCARVRAGAGALRPRNWGKTALCGLLFFVGCHGVLAHAQQQVPSGLAAIMLATIPFWIALLSIFVPRRDPPSRLTWSLLVPGLLGVALIAWHDVGSSGLRWIDIALLLAAAASWALGTVLSNPNSDAPSPLALSGWELVFGGAALLIIGVGLGEFHSFDFASISGASFIAWGYLTGAGTIVAFAAYMWLLKRVAPTTVATYTFVNPIVAVCLGWAVLGETPSLWTLLGAILVIGSVAGLLLAQRIHARARQPASQRRH